MLQAVESRPAQVDVGRCRCRPQYSLVGTSTAEYGAALPLTIPQPGKSATFFPDFQRVLPFKLCPSRSSFDE